MAQNFYHDTLVVEKGNHVFYHDSVFQLTDEIEFTENQLTSESFGFMDEVLWFQESQIMQESLKNRLSFELNQYVKEEFLPYLPLENKTRNKREWMKIFEPSSQNPPYHYETWYIENPETGTSLNRVLTAYYPGIIKNVSVHCKDKGTAGTTKIDIKVNGDSIFYQDSDRPKLKYNSSKDYGDSDIITQDLVSNGDEITLDILDTATNVEGMTVNIAIAQTSVPLSVKKVEAVNADGFVYSGTDILPTDSVYFKIYFSTSIIFIPKILIEDSDGNATSVDIDSTDSDLIDNDVIITKSVDTSDYSGEYKLSVKDALSYTGSRQEDFERTYSFMAGALIDYLSYDRFTNESDLEISVERSTLYSNSISKYSYSLNNTDWTEDTDISNPFTVDLTNSEVGGNSSEGAKTIYLRFKNDAGGYVETEIEVGYYFEPISMDITTWRGGDQKYNIYYRVPEETSRIVPPKKIEIYNGNESVYSRDFADEYIEGFGVVEVTYDSDEEEFSVPVQEGYIMDEVEPIHIEGETITIDKPTLEDNDEDRMRELLYFVCITKDTNEITSVLVSSKITKLTEDPSIFEDKSVSFTYDELFKALNDYTDDYIPLYAVIVRNVFDEALTRDLRLYQRYIPLDLDDDIIDLSAVFEDMASRTYTEDIFSAPNNVPLRIKLFDYEHDYTTDDNDYIKNEEINSGTIVNPTYECVDCDWTGTELENYKCPDCGGEVTVVEKLYLIEGYEEANYWESAAEIAAEVDSVELSGATEDSETANGTYTMTESEEDIITYKHESEDIYLWYDTDNTRWVVTLTEPGDTGTVWFYRNDTEVTGAYENDEGTGDVSIEENE